MTDFTEAQIEAALHRRVVQHMPARVAALPTELRDRLAAECVRRGMKEGPVRDAIKVELELRVMGLDIASRNPESLTPEARAEIIKLRQTQAEDDDYIARKQMKDTAREETKVATDAVLEAGMKLLNMMQDGKEPDEAQMRAFVEDFLKLPGQKDDLIHGFDHAQRAMTTTAETLERAKNEYRAAKEQHQKAVEAFTAIEFFLRETLTWVGMETEGDPATRSLVGTKLAVRATKAEHGILYAVMEKVD